MAKAEPALEVSVMALLRAEMWIRVYVAEYSALRAKGGRDSLRETAADAAYAAASDFDTYCRQQRAS